MQGRIWRTDFVRTGGGRVSNASSCEETSLEKEKGVEATEVDGDDDGK